ncbi:MAG: MATE family efflux transporter, partial [Acidimicrobiia bacterium]|nr:MATE family efflux transporter [Acidimicrobiia bacterium]
GRSMALVSLVFGVMGLAVARSEAGLGWLWTALTAYMVLRGLAVWWRWRSDRWLVVGSGVS